MTEKNKKEISSSNKLKADAVSGSETQIPGEQNQSVSWRAAEYEYVRKGAGWYWIIGLITAVLVLVAFWQKNFFFAVFIIFAGIILMFLGKRRPQTLEFKIDDKGIAIGALIFYNYDRFEGFVIRKRPNRLDEIVLKKKTTVNPYVKIPIDSELAVRARGVLGKELPEIEYQESLIDFFSEWLGF